MLTFLRLAPTADTRPCVVYAAYNHADEIIYLGISCDSEQRWRQHEADKPWAHEVAMWRELEWFATRAEALARETYLIRTWPTRWNIDESPVADEVRARYQREFGYVPDAKPRQQGPWPLRLLLWTLKALLWIVWTLTTGTLRLAWVVFVTVLRSLFGVKRRRYRRRR